MDINMQIKDSDVLVKITGSMGSEYAVEKVTNMEMDEVRFLLDEFIEMVKRGEDNDVHTYLEDRGAELFPVMGSYDSDEDQRIFYDLEYDIDTNVVYDRRYAPVKEQVEDRIARLEFGNPIFQDIERNLLMEYGERLGDVETLFAMINELHDCIRNGEDILRERIRYKLESEIKLYTTAKEMFGIYQLRDSEELHYHRFEPLDRLERFGRKVEKKNYELIYIASLQRGQTLDDIFEEFNLYRPEDFQGHSLSVSDVILLHANGENKAMYVDDFGFQEVPQFMQNLQISTKKFIDHFYVVDDLQNGNTGTIYKFDDLDAALEKYFSLPNHKLKALGIQNTNPMPGSLDFIQCINGIDKKILDFLKAEGWGNPEIREVINKIGKVLDAHDTEIVYKMPDKFLHVQTTIEGIDYTFYDGKYKKDMDGGVYMDMSLQEAVEILFAEEGVRFDECEVVDCDQFLEEMEIANRIAIKENKYPEIYRNSFTDAKQKGEVEQYYTSTTI